MLPQSTRCGSERYVNKCRATLIRDSGARNKAIMVKLQTFQLNSSQLWSTYTFCLFLYFWSLYNTIGYRIDLLPKSINTSDLWYWQLKPKPKAEAKCQRKFWGTRDRCQAKHLQFSKRIFENVFRKILEKLWKSMFFSGLFSMAMKIGKNRGPVSYILTNRFQHFMQEVWMKCRSKKQSNHER